jgi:hypothetical protein
MFPSNSSCWIGLVSIDARTCHRQTFFRLANVKRDDLLQHQQTLDQWIQTYNLIPTHSTTKSNVRCLSLFLSIAQLFKSNAADFLDTTALANQIRDATYQQIQSNMDFYEKYTSSSSNTVEFSRDCQSMIESNYYRQQLEQSILFALAHVLQCNLVVCSSASSKQQPDIIQIDNHALKEPGQVIVLLKNESTQRFTSARTSCK